MNFIIIVILIVMENTNNAKNSKPKIVIVIKVVLGKWYKKYLYKASVPTRRQIEVKIRFIK